MNEKNYDLMTRRIYIQGDYV